MTAPSSNRLARSPFIAGIVLLLVAVSGGIAGVAVDRLVLMPHMFRGGHREHHDGRGPPRDHGVRDRIGRELGLSPEQQTRVDSIMDREMHGVHDVRAEVQPRLDSIVARTRRELDAVLTPEQRKKAEEMRKRHPPPPRGPPGGPGDLPPDGRGGPPP